MSDQPSKSPGHGPFGLPFRVEPLDYLLLAIPVAVILRLVPDFAGRQVWLFVVAGAAIIPLAGLMGRATENLAETMGPGIGGLLNATFGNAAELIIALFLLSAGNFELVKASITGSIVGNILLVLGLSVLVGGLYHKKQVFNRTAAGMGATLMALACVGLLVPTLHYQLAYEWPHRSRLQARQVLVEENLISKDKAAAGKGELDHAEKAAEVAESEKVAFLSEEISVVLILVYGLSLVFSLHSHQHLFGGPEEQQPKAGGHHQPEWDRRTSITVLVAATAGVALMSEFLVGSVETAAHALGMNSIFIGVFVVAVIGNAAEHSTAVMVAAKDKMDLAINIAVGSSIQVALFVAPVLVFASLLMGHSPPLDLHFTMMEVIAVIVAIAVVALVAQDGESHWMEGVMLVAVYVVLALAFFHLPKEAQGVGGGGHHTAEHRSGEQ